MSELETYEPVSALNAQMDYARAVASASMLPDNYRGKPADILLAVGLGQSMGLSPAESLYRISVIKGKPTASAELVAANVRKAGHRLRVSIEPGKAVCTIWRSDDPEFAFEVVRDAAWAQSMGLASNDNYRKQGDTMLSWRAITACARLACPEALYGVAYTSDEMYDMNGGPSERSRHEVTVETSGPETSQADTPDSADTHDGVDTSGSEPDVPMVTKAQLAKIGACMGDLDIKERDEALGYVASTIGRTVASRNELTRSEAKTLIDRLEEDLAASRVEDAEVVS